MRGSVEKLRKSQPREKKTSNCFRLCFQQNVGQLAREELNLRGNRDWVVTGNRLNARRFSMFSVGWQRCCAVWCTFRTLHRQRRGYLISTLRIAAANNNPKFAEWKDGFKEAINIHHWQMLVLFYFFRVYGALFKLNAVMMSNKCFIAHLYSINGDVFSVT